MKREEVMGNVRTRGAAAERDAGGTNLHHQHSAPVSAQPASERMGTLGQVRFVPDGTGIATSHKRI